MKKQFYLTHRWDPNRYYHKNSESGSNGNEGVLHIPQSSKIQASPSQHSLDESYSSAEMQSVYSKSQADCWQRDRKSTKFSLYLGENRSNALTLKLFQVLES